MEVLPAERTSDEENKETSTIISKCRSAGILEKGYFGFGIFKVS
jgi:hypothetical protein